MFYIYYSFTDSDQKNILIKGPSMINLLVWTMFGALAGWIISLLYGTGDIENSKHCIYIGIVGALIGGVCVQYLKGEPFARFNDFAVIFSVVGALILATAHQKFST